MRVIMHLSPFQIASRLFSTCSLIALGLLLLATPLLFDLFHFDRESTTIAFDRSREQR